MPAQKEEVEDALAEGVRLHYYTTPVEILGDRRVDRIRVQRMRPGEFDRSGRRKPVPIEGSEFTIKVDSVIVAVGQKPDINIPDLLLDNSMTIQVNKDSLETSVKGVFAGGDCVTGPATVIEAISFGHRAAISIDRYLGGDMYRRKKNYTRKIEYEIYEQPMERCLIKKLPVDERKTGFAEVELGLSEEVAYKEACRCLRCDVKDTEEGGEKNAQS